MFLSALYTELAAGFLFNYFAVAR